MVLYKRKPVKPVPRPDFNDETADLWEIEQTGETFSEYAAYLARRDFYLQKVFTCESTGHSGYTFFEAMESEVEASKEINSIFPEGLRARVLEFVQFRNTARMDDLVNAVYDHFREHYTVGDRVTIETESGKRNGQIKMMTDTSRLHSMISGQPTDEHFRSYTYEIQMEDSQETLTRYKASELQRDRRVYSKLIIKQFLRSAVSREAWNGAPWAVKDHLAKRYNISNKVPEAKTRDAVVAARKAQLNGQVHQPGMPPPYTNGSGPGPGPMPPFPGHHDAGPHPHHSQGIPPGYMRADGPPHHQQHPQHMDGLRHPMPFNLPPPDHLLPLHLQQQFAQQMPPSGRGMPVSLPFPPNFMQYQSVHAPSDAAQQQKLPQQHAPPQLPKPFEMIKYPIEDLRIKQPRVSVTRPALKFFSDDVPEGAEELPEEKKTGVEMKSMGLLLSVWDTLNVHDTIYSLDSFTWDDFVEAMCFSSEDMDCELLTEMHCAVLKQYVSDSGKLQVPLPNLDDDEDSEDEEEESSKETTPELEPPVRTTRSSLRKSEANQIIQKARTPTPEPTEIHKAEEFLKDFDWVEQCKIRNFRDGGWQAILVGLLHRLSFEPAHKEICDEVLATLLPPDEEPSVANIAYNYVYLDVNLRVAALEMAMRLTVTTDHFREQLGASSQEMTRLRKEKIEHQKRRKELADELFKLDIERKIQLPANTPASPTENKENPDVSMADTEDGKEEEAAESGEEGTNRKTRKAVTKTKRKRVSEAARKEKAKKAKIEAAKSKQQKEWEQLLDAIEKKKEELRDCEDNINELDDDLRETMIYRSKVLGKDRFLNKYYWFEANGMPFGGVPNSSTAEYGYANGRVWVQGPDEHELQPNLEAEARAQDMAEFGFDVPMRKEREEGSTHLSKSDQWAYIDDIGDIDKLIAWLDERGVREKALRKQLVIFRDRIAKYMKIMKEQTEAEKTTEDPEEEDDKPRTRNKAAKDSDESTQRCLQWTNSIMREDLGYTHSEEYEEPKKTRKGVATKKGKGRK